ncbi:MAG: hypothetical protein IJM83_07390 [Firmicutes bacterium]|nr:hypothetical protein [Lachnospiraceae bacterium]MBQ7059110.1 hypothetical protein [Bacillota bacterium]
MSIYKIPKYFQYTVLFPLYMKNGRRRAQPENEPEAPGTGAAAGKRILAKRGGIGYIEYVLSQDKTY